MLLKGIILFTLCFCWGRIAINDYAFRAVRPIDVLLVTGILVIAQHPSPLLIISLLFLQGILLFLQMSRGKQWLSFADLCLLTASCLWITIALLPVFFVLLGVILFLYHILTKEERAPFLTLHLLVFLSIMAYQDVSLENIIRRILP